MNDLHKAYAILGLEPGSSMEAINRRYKNLVLAWHPDRFPGVQGKQDAEQELARINNARDVLRDHFDKGGHREAGWCECRNEMSQSTQGAPSQQEGNGPGAKASDTTNSSSSRSSSSSSPWPGQAAKAQGGDGHQAYSAQESAHYSKQSADVPDEQAVHNAFRKDEKPTQPNGEALRWMITSSCAAVFALLLFILAISDGLARATLMEDKNSVGQSENWLSYQADKARIANTLRQRVPTSDEILQWRPPFVSNEARADSLSKLAYQQLEVPVNEQKRARDQDLTNAREAIDRYQKCIEFSQKKLNEYEAILACPTTNMLDRQLAISGQITQQKFLHESEENLRCAKQRLNQLQGTENADTGEPQIVPTVSVPPAKAPLENISMDPKVQPDGSMKGTGGVLFEIHAHPSR